MTRTLVFDLGGVLIDINWHCTYQCLKSYAKDKEKTPEELVPQIEQYERGEISSFDFYDAFKRIFDSKLSLKDFERCWNNMIFNFPEERFLMLQELKNKYNLILLSNINDMHYKYVMKKFGSYFKIFDKIYFSHLIGMRKPEKRIFEKLVSENSLIPGEIIYFDDTEKHLKTAETLGINTVLVEKSILDITAQLGLN